MRKVFALLAVVLTNISGAARAEINIVDSLEWMSVDARLIVRGKVVRCDDVQGPGDVTYRDTTVEIAEVIKGKPEGKTVTIRLRFLGKDTAGAAWKESGHTYLFFLTQGKVADDKNLAGHWVLREWHYSVVDLDKPGKVYTAEMKPADDGKAILATVKKYAAMPMPRDVGEPNVFKPQRGFLRFEVPPDSPIFVELWSGSSVYLHVPAEEKLRPFVFALARSKDASERARGADMLRSYPGKETVKLLNELLNDPAESRWIGANGKLTKISYNVRRAAYDSLLDLGEKPEKPVFEREPTAADQKKE
jgi:hypothetical protein